MIYSQMRIMDDLISRLMIQLAMAIANGNTKLADDLADAIKALKGIS